VTAGVYKHVNCFIIMINIKLQIAAEMFK